MAAPLPGLSSIASRLTAADYQKVANQLRASGGNVAYVGGRPYQIYSPQFAAQILQRYPAAPEATAPATPTYFGAGGTAPETTALGQMAQIDPQSEALRKQIAASYISPVPQMQQYLRQYGQIDPSTYAGMQELSRQVSANLALGSYLDPSTARQVEQATRAAQGARGNVYGTPQMVEEAMTRGQAGMQIQQQREQAMQSYLASGVSPASTAYNLLRGGQQAGLSYLGSGQTPYQAGAGYLANAQQQAAAAAQGGPTYQAGALGSPYSYMNPQAGGQMSQQANQWYQNMLYGYGQQQAYGRQRNPLGSALGGAASGAVSGAIAGSVIPGVGTAVGAIGGGLLGGLGGYFSG